MYLDVTTDAATTTTATITQNLEGMSRKSVYSASLNPNEFRTYNKLNENDNITDQWR